MIGRTLCFVPFFAFLRIEKPNEQREFESRRTLPENIFFCFFGRKCGLCGKGGNGFSSRSPLRSLAQ